LFFHFYFFFFNFCAVHILDNTLWFPPLDEADDDGLLAVGGDLRIDRLLLAYRSGIFPWYNEDEIPLWWSPDPRFVLFPSELKVSKSMKQLFRKSTFNFRIDTAFADVISNCRHSKRKGQDGTWISHDIENAYTELHHRGYAHCAETWRDGQLVGGLYGIWLGNVFFGESMFSKEPNASKFAFIHWVEFLKQKGVVMIDCQVYTEHLESLGARMIERDDFTALLETNIPPLSDT
jgi:leucyl/phenylalanyl-tRNA--protein transferase